MTTMTDWAVREHLHRWMADAIRDMSQLHAQNQALVARIQELEWVPLTPGPGLNDLSMAGHLQNEVNVLKRELRDNEAKHHAHIESIQSTWKKDQRSFMQEIHRLSEQCRTQAEEKQVCNLQIQQQQAEIDELRQVLNNHELDGMSESQIDTKIREELHALRCSAETAKSQEIELAAQLQKAMATITRLQAQEQPRPSLLTLLDSQGQASGGNVIIDDTNTYSHVPSYMCPLPDQRKTTLDSYPVINIQPENYAGDALFSRKFLSEQLGGGTQSLIVSIDVKKSKALAAKHEISGYLCPNRDHNLWCPTRPGMHGYMFVGLGREAITFAKTETRHVFVGMGPKQYRYLGLYEAVRVDGLTVAEWDPLPEDFKTKYSTTTADKSKNDTRSPSQIRTAYDEGKLLVPCVQLKCVGYDKELFHALVGTNERDVIATSQLRSISSASAMKRVHTADSLDDLGSPRRKSARTSV